MSYASEFKTVDLIVHSSSVTRGVDAFALALIKTERQIRKLFTHLVYQFPCFSDDDICRLRETLGNNRRIYFEGFEHGFNALFPHSIAELVGTDYARLRSRLNEAIDCRNKIFHGQLTTQYLSRDDLLSFVIDIRSWCEALATSAISHIGYDGFARDSFQKSKLRELWKEFKVQFTSIDDYSKFIQQYMQRAG